MATKVPQQKKQMVSEKNGVYYVDLSRTRKMAQEMIDLMDANTHPKKPAKTKSVAPSTQTLIHQKALQHSTVTSQRSAEQKFKSSQERKPNSKVQF